MTRAERNIERAEAERARRAGQTIYVGSRTGIARSLQPGYEAEAARITEANQAAVSAAKDAKVAQALAENKRNVSRAQAYLNSQPSGPQQGSYYTSTGQYTGPTGGGIQASRLPGSVRPQEYDRLQQEARTAQQQGNLQRASVLQQRATQVLRENNPQAQQRAAILARQTATQQLGQRPGPISYSTRQGQTSTTIPERKLQPVITASPAFAGKASSTPGVQVGVREDIIARGPTGLRPGVRSAITGLDEERTENVVDKRNTFIAPRPNTPSPFIGRTAKASPFIAQPTADANVVFNQQINQRNTQSDSTTQFTQSNRINGASIIGDRKNSSNTQSVNGKPNVPLSVKPVGQTLSPNSSNIYQVNYLKPSEEAYPEHGRVDRYLQKVDQTLQEGKSGLAYLGGLATGFVRGVGANIIDDLAYSRPIDPFKYNPETGKFGAPSKISIIPSAKTQQEKPITNEIGNFETNPVKQGEAVGMIVGVGLPGALENFDDVALNIGKKVSSSVSTPRRYQVSGSVSNARVGQGLNPLRTPVEVDQSAQVVVTRNIQTVEQKSYLGGLIKTKPKITGQTVKEGYFLETQSKGGVNDRIGALKSKTTIQPATPDYLNTAEDVAGRKSVPISYTPVGKPVKISQGVYGFENKADGVVEVVGRERTRTADFTQPVEPRKNLDKSLARVTETDYKVRAETTIKNENLATQRAVIYNEGQTSKSQSARYFQDKDILNIRDTPTKKLQSVEGSEALRVGTIDQGPAKRIVRYNTKTGEFVETQRFTGGQEDVIIQKGTKIDYDIPVTPEKKAPIIEIIEKPQPVTSQNKADWTALNKKLDDINAQARAESKIIRPETPQQANILNKQQASNVERAVQQGQPVGVQKRIIKDFAGGTRTRTTTAPIEVKVPISKAANIIGKTAKTSAIIGLLPKSNILQQRKSSQNLIGRTGTGLDSSSIVDLGQGSDQRVRPEQKITPERTPTQRQYSFLTTDSTSITVPFNQIPQTPYNPVKQFPPIIPFGGKLSGGRPPREYRNYDAYKGVREYKIATPKQFFGLIANKNNSPVNNKKRWF